MALALRNTSHKSEMRAWMREKHGDNWSTKKSAMAEYKAMKATHSSRRPARKARKNPADPQVMAGLKKIAAAGKGQPLKQPLNALIQVHGFGAVDDAISALTMGVSLRPGATTDRLWSLWHEVGEWEANPGGGMRFNPQQYRARKNTMDAADFKRWRAWRDDQMKGMDRAEKAGFLRRMQPGDWHDDYLADRRSGVWPRPARKARKNAMDPAPWVGVKITRTCETYRGFKTRRGAEKFASGRKKNVFRGPFEIGYGFLGAGSSVDLPREEARPNGLGLQGFGGQKLARWNGPSDTHRLLTLTNWEIRSQLSRHNPFDPETDEPPESAIMTDVEFQERARRRYMGATPRRPSEVIVARGARKAGYKGSLSAVEIALRDRDETSDVGLLKYIETIRSFGKRMQWPKSQIERYRGYAITEANRRVKLKTSRIYKQKGTKTGYALATRSEWGKKGHLRGQRRKADEYFARYQAEQRAKHLAKLTGYRRDAYDLGIKYVGRKKVDVIADIQAVLAKQGRGRSAGGFPEIERAKKKAKKNAKTGMRAGVHRAMRAPEQERELMREALMQEALRREEERDEELERLLFPHRFPHKKKTRRGRGRRAFRN